MTVLELIKKSAIILNIEQILNDKNLEDLSYSEEDTVLAENFTLNRLFELAKLVVNEVTSYSPRIAEKQVTSSNKKVMLAQIGNLEKVISVKNDNGCVKFDIRGANLCFEQDGTYTIVYQESHPIESLLNPIYIYGGIGEELLVMGLNAYYCLANGLYAEYNVYNEQYVDKLSRLKNLKLFAMPCRSWND